ncbi:hypothetical protein [Myxococcus stipitatus]|uniref:hypothetical protein n=1 Tax=Myxococcus stipitatus TaxID=83455 RepID=UPI0030D041FE
MAAKNPGPFKGLLIRTAGVLSSRYGVIYACDPKRERRGEPHAYVFVWDDGQVERGDANYDAHSFCLIESPVQGSVDISETGYYTADSDDDRVTQDLFAHSAPAPKTRRARGLRSVREIDGWAHAIGLRGMVYRMDTFERWKRIDEGLPASFDGHAIHGLGRSKLFAVGSAGQVWHSNGKTWRQEVVPTQENLSAVVCAPDGTVYVAGRGGTLIRGTPGDWSLIEQTATRADIWGLEWFAGKLFVSTLEGLFTLERAGLRPVDHGKHAPRSTHQLSTREGVLWSIGETDIVEFDGKAWSRIV